MIDVFCGCRREGNFRRGRCVGNGVGEGLSGVAGWLTFCAAGGVGWQLGNFLGALGLGEP